MKILTLLWLVLSVLSPLKAATNQGETLVFAAASLKEVMNDAATEFKRKNPGEVSFNFAGSNVLAQQINANAQADLFISANEEWVEAIEKSDRANKVDRRVLFSNQLAIIANKTANWTVVKPEDLAKIPFRFLSIGDPKAVPAGKYAKAFLEKVKVDGSTLWDRVSERVAPGADVRVALSVVEADPTVVGIVYRTDAKTSSKVKIIYEIPADQSKPIEYFLTKVKTEKKNPYSDAFLDFLASKEAKKIFVDRGFFPIK